MLGRAALEADGAAIGDSGWLAVDGLGEAERTAVMAIEQPDVSCARDIANGLARAQGAEHGVIETFGALDVVRADHDVVEHGEVLEEASSVGVNLNANVMRQ